MNWNSAAEFLSMGGKGLYVWGSYLVTLLVVVTELASLFMRRRSLLVQLRRLIRSKSQTTGGSKDET